MTIEQIGRFFIYAWAEKSREAWMGHWSISTEKHGKDWHPHGPDAHIGIEPCLSERVAELDAYMQALSALKARILAAR